MTLDSISYHIFVNEASRAVSKFLVSNVANSRVEIFDLRNKTGIGLEGVSDVIKVIGLVVSPGCHHDVVIPLLKIVKNFLDIYKQFQVYPNTCNGK